MTPQLPEGALQVSPERRLAERPAAMMEAIQRAAMDPACDVAKMQALLDMAERMQATNARIEYQAALARIQEVMPRIGRDGKITVNSVVRSRYATLERIDKIVKPLLAAEGFSLQFDTAESGSKITVFGKLAHREGHFDVKQIALALESSGAKNSVQAMGSTISYGQRYLIKMFLNIVEEGEDTGGQPPLEAITTDQAIVIRDLIREVGANEAKFLAYIGVESVEQISKRDYDRTISELERKRK